MSPTGSPPGNLSGSAGGITPSKSKEKKKVGWTEGQRQSAHDDSIPSDQDTTAVSTPGIDETINERYSGGVDHQELSAALTRILQPEPAHPEPSYYPSSRQQQSEQAAKERADRLAESVERSFSAPASARTSLDEDTDRLDHALFASGVSRSGSRTAAERLVRSHTQRPPKRPGRNALHSSAFQYDASPRSGQVTPTGRFDHEHEYVPQPSKYQGGILASLLKLYNGAGHGSGDSSGSNTPSRPATPGSGASTPKRHSGIFPNRYGKQSTNQTLKDAPYTSTSGLAGLVGPSTILASPGSGDAGHMLSEQVKKELPKPKQNRSSLFSLSPKSREDEQIRITIHIADVLSRHRYLIKLCRALMMYGAPTHRLEDYLKMSARVLEIECQFLYIPGCMFISFDDSSTHTAEVKLVRAPQGVDLGKLRDVHGIYKEVVHDLISVDEGTVRLEAVMGRKEKFNPWLLVPVYGLASVCVAPFAFQGRFIDLPVAFLLGCIVGGLALFAAPSSELYANVFEISAAVVTSFLARAFGSIAGGRIFCFSALAQSSIALILPGYMVLCSSLELQSHNIVAGSVRMIYALIYTLFLGYGITIGTTIYGVIDGNATSQTNCENPLDRSWYFLFVPLFTVCLCVINQAKWKQIPVMVLIAIAGFCVNTYASDRFSGNAQIANTLGALCVGVLANLYSRLSRPFESFFLGVWNSHILPGVSRLRKKKDRGEFHKLHRLQSDDVENQASEGREGRAGKKAPGHAEVIGYGLAAAAMLPAIFVQVPSGIAANGSLFSSINTANQITGNTTVPVDGTGLNSVSFTVLFSVIQVAIGITVGLFLSALLVYPLGKRRSALFSF